jgi:hypothetical protein
MRQLKPRPIRCPRCSTHRNAQPHANLLNEGSRVGQRLRPPRVDQRDGVRGGMGSDSRDPPACIRAALRRRGRRATSRSPVEGAALATKWNGCRALTCCSSLGGCVTPNRSIHGACTRACPRAHSSLACTCALTEECWSQPRQEPSRATSQRQPGATTGGRQVELTTVRRGGQISGTGQDLKVERFVPSKHRQPYGPTCHLRARGLLPLAHRMSRSTAP